MKPDDYKIHFDTLSIECTRRCNMKCAHCMRGNAQRKDLNPDAVYQLFQRVDSIWTIVPTGGEPSLNPAALDTITDAIKRYGVSVSGMFIVTNGKTVSDEFIRSMMNLILATDGDEESVGIALSQDMFHDKIPYENLQRLKLFAGFDPESKKTDWNRVPPMAIGRAENLSLVRTCEKEHSDPFYDAEIDDERKVIRLINGPLALTVDGNLVSDCNYAYSEVRKLTLCNVFDDDWVETLLRKTRRAIQKQSA